MGSRPQSPGKIQDMHPPSGSIIYSMGVLESRIGGSVFWILPGLWKVDSEKIGTWRKGDLGWTSFILSFRDQARLLSTPRKRPRASKNSIKENTLQSYWDSNYGLGYFP